MKNYGSTVRQIRLSKGFSHKEIYTGILSKSFAIDFEKGLYDSITTLPFCDGNEVLSGKIGDDDANSKIHTIDIDSVINGKVTFIKMDIEGAELNALKGAEKTIIRNKPKLAICIYHKPEDMWQIPRYIDSLVPEYKFYIRHFGMRYAGTILYCSVK